jgi:hypothetical protein
MQIKKWSVLLFFAIAIVVLSCSNYRVDSHAAKTINSVKTINYDMKPPHEGSPQGVPSNYSWASGPRIGMGNNSQGFKAMTAWGQLYEDAAGNPATSTRVQMANIQTHILSKKDRKWHCLQSSKLIAGAAYKEDYVNDINKPPDIRYEQDGSISVKAGEGYNFHFWDTDGRVEIAPDDIGGVFTTVQARLITDNLQKPDDRDRARYLLSMGGDYWLNLTAKWNNGQTNADIAIGKFKYVKQEWQAFNMTTLSPEEIRRNPPPIQ